MKVVFSKSQKVKKEKYVVINDVFRGPIKLVSDEIYRFKLMAVANCGSCVSFLKVNEHIFISVKSFMYDFLGHYVINLKDQVLEPHKIMNVQVDLEPVVRCNPEELEEWRYEKETL